MWNKVLCLGSWVSMGSYHLRLRQTKKNLSRIYIYIFQDEEEDIYFPDDKDHINSFSYLIIDPYKRHVTILHHKYAGGIW